MDIYSKETKHTAHEKAAYLTKFHSTVQVQRTEYKVLNIFHPFAIPYLSETGFSALATTEKKTSLWRARRTY
jgi:hypothetical protein